MEKKNQKPKKLFVAWGGATDEETGLIVVDTQRDRSQCQRKRKELRKNVELMRREKNKEYIRQQLSTHTSYKFADVEKKDDWKLSKGCASLSSSASSSVSSSSSSSSHHWTSKTDRQKCKVFAKYSSVLPLEFLTYAIPYLSPKDIHRSLMTSNHFVFNIVWSELKMYEKMDHYFRNGHLQMLERCLNDTRTASIQLSMAFVSNLFFDMLASLAQSLRFAPTRKRSLPPQRYTKNGTDEWDNDKVAQLLQLLVRHERLSWSIEEDRARILDMARCAARLNATAALELLLTVIQGPGSEQIGSLFSESNIKALTNLPRVCTVLLNDGRVVLPMSLQKKLFKGAIEDYNHELLNLLLEKQGFNPVVGKYSMFLLACACGNEHAVRAMMKHPYTDPSFNDNEPLFVTATNQLGSKSSVLDVLLSDERVGLTHNGKCILTVVALSGNISTTRKMMHHRCATSELLNRAFETLCKRYREIEKNPADMIQLLISDERVDPTLKDNRVLMTAIQDGVADLVHLLVKNPIIRGMMTQDRRAEELARVSLEKKPTSFYRNQILQLLTEQL